MVAVFGFEVDLSYIVYIILIGINAGIGYKLLKVQDRYYERRMALEEGRRADAAVYYAERLVIERGKLEQEKLKVEVEHEKLRLRQDVRL